IFYSFFLSTLVGEALRQASNLAPPALFRVGQSGRWIREGTLPLANIRNFPSFLMI
ncbi:unnamed protein product, partial [Nesidiocoris tenuis]